MPIMENLTFESTDNWVDYELLDSGLGKKFERFGKYTFIRPEPQAIWKPILSEWKADAEFKGYETKTDGRWQFNKNLDKRWEIKYQDIKFWAEATPFRHLGVFPEQASQWEWMSNLVKKENRPLKVLNLFGYTGLASIYLSKHDVEVTHVDASKKAVTWAHDNQILSGLENKHIRWIVEDVVKFVKREIRRGSVYDGITLDPPKFGRGPAGEIWKIEDDLVELLNDCHKLLTVSPVFFILTTYSSRLSSLSLYNAVKGLFEGNNGKVSAGEIITLEKSGGRSLSNAIFARWQKA